MDKSLYNASGCKDRTAHDAICAADRTRTLVYRASRTKKDEEAELFVKMVKRLAKGFGFKLCDRIKFEDPETGKKYVEVWHGYREKSTIRSTDKRGN